MKFRTSIFSKLNPFSTSSIAFDNSRLTIVTNGKKETVHVNNIAFIGIDTPRIGFSRLDIIRNMEGKTITIHGFTERQCKEIYTLINLGQTRNIIFYPLDQRVNLAQLHSLVRELKKLSSPKKFERPLVAATILRLEEGLKIVRKLVSQEVTDETL